MKKHLITGIFYGLVAISTVYAQNLKLNQIGFYPKSEKTAIIPDGQFGDLFHILEDVSKDTVFTGVIQESNRWGPSQEDVSQADFSALVTPGKYTLVVGTSQSSYSFEIITDLYQDLLKASVKAFYYQRCSTPLLTAHAGVYNRNLGQPDDHVFVHPDAASSERPSGTMLSMPKGWYDAGDYNKYIVNSGISTYTMLAAFEHFAGILNPLEINIPESGDTTPDILDEIKWNLDWMLAMQDPNDGGVYHKLSFKNFSGYVLPEMATADRFVLPKTTTATFDFSAVMAQASRVFEAYESNFPGFTEQCYQASLKAWKWARSNPNIVYKQPGDIKTGEYGDTNLKDELQWAAAELYITTKADSFYIASETPSINPSVPSWQSVSMLGLLSLAKHRNNLTDIADKSVVEMKIIELANKLREAYQTSPYHITMGNSSSDFVWGSNGLAANQSLILLSAFDLTNDGSYFSAANSNLDYLLGRNPLNYSYVTGFGDNSPRNPHHRVSISDNISEPVPGLLAGGPNSGQQDGCNYSSNLPALSYVDDICSYASNEIAINWNAPFLFVVAGISDALKQESQKPPFIITQSETELVRENETATLVVKVGGMEPISYQWIKNDEEISGANTEALTVLNVNKNNEVDTYKVRISNDKGEIITNTMKLKIENGQVVTSLFIDAAKTSTIYFSPNPTKDKRIHLNNLVTNAELIVTDSSGHESRPKIQRNNYIDLSYLPEGVYFLQLVSQDTGEILTTTKIVLD